MKQADVCPGAELNAFDRIALIVGAVMIAMVFAFPFWPAPIFAAMFRDFGSRELLPRVTRLVVTPWFGPLLGLPPAAWLAFACIGAKGLNARRWLIVAGFLNAAGALGFCYAAIYRPILQLADAIKP